MDSICVQDKFVVFFGGVFGGFWGLNGIFVFEKEKLGDGEGTGEMFLVAVFGWLCLGLSIEFDIEFALIWCFQVR